MRLPLDSRIVTALVWAGLLGFAVVPGRAQPLAETPAEAPADKKADDPEGILNMDVEQLAKVNVVAPSLNMEVTTVERTKSTVGHTAAAVFVVTNEMIRRSGARTIPDVLRLVPGVEVVQKTANTWCITIRGFNGTNADKLLVQIDGRSVYSPLYGGTYWDIQDLVLEDIERIEVIRGPGGTLWGANAVNGVINIITKDSKDTQGGYFEAGGGTLNREFSTARYGGQLGDDATYRVYGKWFENAGEWNPETQSQGPDAWRQARTGFRTDWDASKQDKATLQGDYYNGYDGVTGELAQSTAPYHYRYAQDQHVSGSNILGRWTHTLENDTDWSFQWYYDRMERHDEVLPLTLNTGILDLDFQYHFPLGENHDFVCGGGYRNYRDDTRGIPLCIGFNPADRTDDLYNCYVQDDITLRENVWHWIVGSKFEHNNYTGFEFQPTTRLLWTPDEKHCIWGAISRAVQTPTRLTDDGIGTKFGGMYGPLPIFRTFSGSSSIAAADVLAYEVGMRAQPVEAFYWDLALFYNNYQNLVGFQPGTPYIGTTPDGNLAAFVPATAFSDIAAESYGFELAAGYQVTKHWKFRAEYSFLRLFEHESADEVAYLGEDVPRNMYSLWLSGDLGHHWNLDLIGRYSDEMKYRYFVGDVRLAWRPNPHVEWSVVGRNLLAGAHPECGGRDLFGVVATDVQPEVYGALSYRF